MLLGRGGGAPVALVIAADGVRICPLRPRDPFAQQLERSCSPQQSGNRPREVVGFGDTQATGGGQVAG